jgi:hypothetical protein
MLISKELQAKLGKTWLFSESAYTSLLPGGLVLKQMAMKPWRYHVALVFRDTDGQILVLDPVEKQWPQPVPLSQWTDQIERSQNSLLPIIQTTLHGNLYLFYSHLINGVDNNPGALNNGQFFEYEGLSKENEFIPRSLSRDDVAVSDEAVRCGSLKQIAEDADKLQQVLNCVGRDGDAPCANQTLDQSAKTLRVDCPAVVDLYRKRLEFWRKRLP